LVFVDRFRWTATALMTPSPCDCKLRNPIKPYRGTRREQGCHLMSPSSVSQLQRRMFGKTRDTSGCTLNSDLQVNLNLSIETISSDTMMVKGIVSTSLVRNIVHRPSIPSIVYTWQQSVKARHAMRAMRRSGSVQRLGFVFGWPRSPAEPHHTAHIWHF
jgi:hypothetical protein